MSNRVHKRKEREGSSERRQRKRVCVEKNTIQNEIIKEEVKMKVKKAPVALLGKGVDFMAVGSNFVGQTGTGEDDDVEKFKEVKKLQKVDVAAFVAGGGVNLAVIVEGDSTVLYTWGCSDDGLLGRTSSEDEDAPNAARFPGKVEHLQNKIITKVSAGEYHALALTDENELFSWGTYKDPGGYLGYSPEIDIQRTPRRIDEKYFRGQKIVDIASNENVSWVLTDHGKVYYWGYTRLASARGSSRDVIRKRSLIPTEVPFGPRTKIVKLATANHGFHMFFQDSAGEFWAWGLNNFGQLGLDDTTSRERPEKVPELKQLGITTICVGQHHTLGMTAHGVVYAWGKGDYGQLGIGQENGTNPRFKKRPTRVIFFDNLPNGDRVVQIAVGANHSLALTSSGRLYSWGFGESAQLGHGLSTSSLQTIASAVEEHTPRLVTYLGHRIPIAVFGGGTHTMLIGRRQTDDTKTRTERENEEMNTVQKNEQQTRTERENEEMNTVQKNEQQTLATSVLTWN